MEDALPLRISLTPSLLPASADVLASLKDLAQLVSFASGFLKATVMSARSRVGQLRLRNTLHYDNDIFATTLGSKKPSSRLQVVKERLTNCSTLSEIMIRQVSLLFDGTFTSRLQWSGTRSHSPQPHAVLPSLQEGICHRSTVSRCNLGESASLV